MLSMNRFEFWLLFETRDFEFFLSLISDRRVRVFEFVRLMLVADEG